jgi:hypothetical protein
MSMREHTPTAPATASALLQAAQRARASLEPTDLVKYTSSLAHELGVTRQTVHTWRRRPDAPKRTGGYWSVREWQEYVKACGLANAQTVDRTTVITEICTSILNNLPPRLSRHRLQQLLARVEIALHISLPGSRFRSGGCDSASRRAHV